MSTPGLPTDIASPPADTADESTSTGLGWLLRVWLVVVAFGAVTLARSLQVGIPLRDPRGSILITRVSLSLAIFAVLVVLDATARGRSAAGERPAWSARRSLRVLREKWTARRLALAMSALAAYHLVYLFYHNLKSWDVLNQPRDTMLLAWDRWLFFGHSPAVLLHDLLGQHVAAYVLLVIYESFSTIVAIAVVASVVLPDRIREGYVYITSGMWVWILGVGSYYLIPSLGPFHSAPRDFAGLPHTMVQDTQARYLAQRVFLLAHPESPRAFAQVSAFASLHVAVTCLILLMARYYGLRRTSVVLTVFVLGTMVATIYLGWHFVVDDVAGVAIALLAVWLGRTTVRASPGRVMRR